MQRKRSLSVRVVLWSGDLDPGAAITTGANTVINGRIHAGAAITLGAGSYISGSAVSDINVIMFGAGATVGDAAVPNAVPNVGVCTVVITGLGQVICNNYGTAATAVTLKRRRAGYHQQSWWCDDCHRDWLGYCHDQ